MKSHILLVDDSDFDREHAAMLLSDLCAEFKFATDGEDAWQQLQRFSPDLIVSDLQMEPVGGLELLQRVREHKPEIPVIVMTSRGSEESAVSALQLGAASYIPKRKLRDLLRETVERVLRSAHRRSLEHSVRERRTRERISLQIENDLGLVSSVVRMLAELGEDFGVLDEARRVRVSVALEEAIVNAIVHGNLDVSSDLREREDDAYHELIEQRRGQEPWSNRQVVITAEATPDAVQYQIQDNGCGFDVSRLRDPTEPSNMLLASGRGILLMRSFMDDVQFSDGGTCVRLTARRQPQKVSAETLESSTTRTAASNSEQPAAAKVLTPVPMQSTADA